MGKSSTKTTKAEVEPVPEIKAKKHLKQAARFRGETTAKGKDFAEPDAGIQNTSTSTSENPIESLLETTRPKKSKAGKAPEVEGDVEVAPVASKKKEKKRKRRDVDPTEQGDNGKGSKPEAAEEPPKKKHKNRTEFADPREDGLLNGQSRKALEYAFTQMNRPKKWKFNKARQNWIIRNVWSSENLPEAYFPLALKYLANLQGGSREKLRETCQTYLKVEEKVEAPSPDSRPPTSTDTSPLLKSALEPSKPTPGPLISATPVPGSLTSTTPTPGALIPPTTDMPTSAATSVSPSPAILAETRRKRARSLLDLLA